MKALLDRVLVVDVEATCWEGAPPGGQVSDIIEIGVCEYDVALGERVERHSLLVRPTRSEVSPFCTSLTTLTQEQVGRGLDFGVACARLRELGSHERVWASYGDYDRKQFQRQCADLGVPYPFGPRHLNVKTLFALTRGLHREVGMAQALALAGLPLDGTHHRGDDDAWNIAALLGTLLVR
ncbi:MULTISPECIES: 3'-5' exonuclease [Actinosynnema]|uniref:DNA polymerase III n=1 Tax=Actinosynnema pretiosum TaxID=42197 RepID=A0A290Z2H3_9PSEU|nr:3'-5' exonuclease [Actinosynnema pretiosum]ATE53230.1 DNA polymerase III [Actinosynnema pretiosum]